MGETVLVERHGAIATVTLNRPEVLNAVNATLAGELFHELATLERDAEVRCVILRGSGGHFMAGGDLKTFYGELERDPEERRRHFELFVGQVHPIVQTLRRMPKPVIASVEGAAGGFGMSLMMACDLAVVADNSFYTMAYTLIGTSPDGSSTWFLPRLVGLRKAMELAMLSDRFDAETAQAYGLVNRVVSADALEAETLALAERLANGPTHAYGNTKRLLNRSLESGLDAQLQAEAESFSDCAATEDFVEGIAAFVEKRNPSFKGS